MSGVIVTGCEYKIGRQSNLNYATFIISLAAFIIGTNWMHTCNACKRRREHTHCLWHCTLFCRVTVRFSLPNDMKFDQGAGNLAGPNLISFGTEKRTVSWWKSVQCHRQWPLLDEFTVLWWQDASHGVHKTNHMIRWKVICIVNTLFSISHTLFPLLNRSVCIDIPFYWFLLSQDKLELFNSLEPLLLHVHASSILL